jgi:hypothetical protein
LVLDYEGFHMRKDFGLHDPLSRGQVQMKKLYENLSMVWTKGNVVSCLRGIGYPLSCRNFRPFCGG